MFANKLKMDSVAEAVKQIMGEEESGLRMAAHAAHRQGKKMFSFQGKTYPVKVQGEEVTYGEAFSEEADCVTEPKAKEIAKKEVHGHEKKMHHEEIDPKVRTKDMIRGRKPTDQKDDVGPGADGKSLMKAVLAEDKHTKETLDSRAVVFAANVSEMSEKLSQILKDGDVLITMGAGSISKLPQMLVELGHV